MVEQEVEIGDTLVVQDYEIEFVKLGIEYDTGETDNELWDTWYVLLNIYKDGDLVGTGRMNFIYSYYYDNGAKIYNRPVHTEVHIQRGLIEDLYLNFEILVKQSETGGYYLSQEEIMVYARVIPMMTPMWTGMTLFLVGICLRIVFEIVIAGTTMKERRLLEAEAEERKDKKRRKDREKRTKTSSKEKDYEALLEQELEKRR